MCVLTGWFCACWAESQHQRNSSEEMHCAGHPLPQPSATPQKECVWKRSLMGVDLWFLLVFWLRVCFIEKVCVWLSRTQQWGTEEKSKVCAHSGFNDVCVLVGKQAVYQLTAAVVGGVMSLTDAPMLRGRSEEWCRIIGGPGSRLNSYLYLLWGSICSTSFSPSSFSLHSFLGFSHIFLSFWLAGAVKYVCRGGSLGNCLKITGWRVANVLWRSDSCARRSDSVIKNKLKSQIHMWSRYIHW